MVVTSRTGIISVIYIKGIKNDIANYRPIYYNSSELTAKNIRYNNRWKLPGRLTGIAEIARNHGNVSSMLYGKKRKPGNAGNQHKAF